MIRFLMMKISKKFVESTRIFTQTSHSIHYQKLCWRIIWMNENRFQIC